MSLTCNSCMQIILKSCRETHCHYCFSEAPADVVFCPLCTIPVYCSRKCQEQAVGGISWNQDTYLKSNSNAVDLGILSLTSTRCMAPNSKQIAEHRHECGGAHWAAVLPADIVLAGRLMAQYIDSRMLTGKSSAISGPNLVKKTYIFHTSLPFSGAVSIRYCNISISLKQDI